MYLPFLLKIDLQKTIVMNLVKSMNEPNVIIYCIYIYLKKNNLHIFMQKKQLTKFSFKSPCVISIPSSTIATVTPVPV